MNRFLTTAVKWSEFNTDLSEEEGQSIIEFLLMLPLMVGMTVILIRVDSAIQISIVDQQYARAQVLSLAENSGYYPMFQFQQRLVQTTQSNQMVVGVSDNPPTGNSYVPKASTQLITRNGGTVASDAPQEEPDFRSLVRVRNSVTLCTPLLVLSTGQSVLPVAYTGSSAIPIGPSSLNNQTQLNYFCGSKMNYEQ